MKLPILRLRDKDGKEVFIPAIRGPKGPAGDGTGDMVAEVYDPTGKATDIFIYADQAAQKAAAENAVIVLNQAAANFAPKDHSHDEYAPTVHEHDYAVVSTFLVDVGTTWRKDEAYGGYCQTVAVSGILASDEPIADVVMTGDAAQNDMLDQAWSKVKKITTAGGTVTFWCSEPPATAFTAKLKVVR